MDALSNSSTIRADAIELWDASSAEHVGIQQLVLGIPPASMNTLEKLAAAIGNDPEYFETIAVGLDSKADLHSPLASLLARSLLYHSQLTGLSQLLAQVNLRLLMLATSS